MRPAPSPLFIAERERLRAAAASGPVLDVACGRGRHSLAAAALGARVMGIDRAPGALAELARTARREDLPVWPVRADLETDTGLPCPPSCFGAILVFRYLHRALAPALAAALRPGGILLYETFLKQQTDLGHGPKHPEFLLGTGELPRLFPTLEELHFEESLRPGDRPEWLASFVARRPR